MKKLSLFLVIAVLSSVSCIQQKKLQIKVQNTQAIDRIGELLVLNRSFFEERGILFSNPAIADGDIQLPVQWDDLDGDGVWDEVAVQVSVKANETKVLQIIEGNLEDKSPSKVGTYLGKKMSLATGVVSCDRVVIDKNGLPWDAKFYPYQMDGPSIENDYVGYRVYFDGRYAKDVFGKKKPGVVLQGVGFDKNGSPVDNYHVMEDWGRDILSVGNSLGAGGMAIRSNGKIFRLGKFERTQGGVTDSTIYRKINTGPVRAIYAFEHFGMDLENHKVDIKEIIEIKAGTHYLTSRVYTQNMQPTDELMIGLVCKDNDKPIMFGESTESVYVGTFDYQTYDKEFIMGLALISQKEGFVEHLLLDTTNSVFDATYTAVYAPAKTNPIRYHIFSCWEHGQLAIKDVEAYKKLVTAELAGIDEPLLVE